MALVEKAIRDEFALDNEQFGWIGAAFYITYALAQIPAGFMADRLNVRKLYMFAVFWWSLAAIASAFSPSLSILILMRILLGVGESFNWPCALQVTSRILPPSDRALGNGIFNSGAAVGAVITPLIVPPLASQFGWRVAFALVGSLGLVWILAWRLVAPPATDSRFAPVRSEQGTGNSNSNSKASLSNLVLPLVIAVVSFFAMGESVGKFRWWVAATVFFASLLVKAVVYGARARKQTDGSRDWFTSLSEIVWMKRFWILVVVSVTINVCWHFLVNWLPGYLRQDRGMSFLASGIWVAMPFLAADGGNLMGGWLSRRIALKKNWPAAKARLTVMAICAVLVSSGALLGLVDNNILAIALLAIMATGAAGFMANYFAFCQEVSVNHTGLIVGVLGGLGNLFAGGFLPYAGQVKDLTGSFAPIFIVVGVLPMVGLLTLALGWGFGNRQDLREDRSGLN